MTDRVAETVSCFHCGTPVATGVDFSVTLGGAPRRFCCFACQSVSSAIFEGGLEGYYQRTPDGQLMGPPPEPPKDIEMYDFDEIQQDFAACRGEFRELDLLVEGIHCAACVWLIERALHRTDGVESAEVNYAAKRVHIRWHPGRVKLSALITVLAQVGYSAVPYDRESAEGLIRKTNRAMLFRLFFAGFAAMNMMWIAIALYAGANEDRFRDFFHWMGFVLATPTLFYAGFPFYRGAIGGLRARVLTMDLPIAIGLSVTYVYSTYVTVSGTRTGEVYFDTVTNLTFVILIGRYLEGLFRQNAVSATQRLMELQPRVALVVRGGEEVLTPIRSVMPGDEVLIKPGYAIPVDGRVLSGESEVVEAMLSGESRPMLKKTGDTVSAGTTNSVGALRVRVTARLQENSLSKIIRLVEAAQSSKAPIQRTADRIVPWFVLITLLCATVTFFLWAPRNFEIALMAATSVLIITCPCALGMATPMSIAVASGLGARHGILVKNGLVLETLSKITDVVFDKTGTLTEGRMTVAGQYILSSAPKDLWGIIAEVERLSEHSVANAIVAHAEQQGCQWGKYEIADFRATPGQGVSATVSGQQVLIGTEGWLDASGIPIDLSLRAESVSLEADAKTVVHVAVDGVHVALLGIADKIRAGAAGLIQHLQKAGLRVTLLSGDRNAVAQAVAAQLGGLQVIAEVLPEDKDKVIQQLQAEGRTVAMVGDGINDAPALIRANVGIALGSGADVSVDSADIVLMQNDLSKVSQALDLSRRTLRTIKQNIGLSFAYNLIMVPLAMAAKVSPLVAAITMPISSLVVIGNAARIRTLFSKTRTIAGPN